MQRGGRLITKRKGAISLKHAYLSASSAHRWLYCTKSPGIESALPDSESEFAAEGTVAHEVASAVINGMGAAEAVKSIEGATDEMGDHALGLKSLADGIVAMEGGEAEALSETRVDFSDYAPGGFGTADVLIIARQAIYVIDYKYGKNVAVKAEGNPQLRLYALGALKLARSRGATGIKNVSMTICQPRKGGDSTEHMPAKNLVAWGREFVAPRAKEAFTGEGAKYSPGEHVCRWCKASKACRARAGHYLTALGAASGLSPLMSTQEIADALTEAEGHGKWIAGLRAELQARLERGEAANGWIIGPGKGSREFTSEKDARLAAAAIGLDITARESSRVMTPAAVEGLIGAKAFKESFGGIVEARPGKQGLRKASE